MLIGRENELALLVDRLAEGRPVAVLGEAGVGKTSLIRAAAERAAIPLREAGALATLSWLPYLPLRRAFGRELEGDAAYVAATVEAELADGLLFLDDLQWADPLTTSLVPLLGGRVALVAALRRGDPGTANALEVATLAGIELLPLEPLDDADAAALARELHPSLSEGATRRLVERSGGNPFLLEQLAATGEPSESLRLTVAARVRALTPVGRDALGALALLGRPTVPRLLGPGAAELIAAGLATGDGEVAIRHALLAEAVVETLEEGERRQIHSRLAPALEEPGEAARHHALAGEREDAFAKALLAAEQTDRLGEQAGHLRLAASCATGAEADRLRLRTAKLLCDAHDSDGVDAILGDVISEDPLVRAEACLTRAHAHWLAARTEKIRGEIEEGLELARGSGTDLEVALVVNRARLPVTFGDAPADALANAEAALGLARSRGCHEAEALFAVGNALYKLDRPRWLDHLLAAVDQARLVGDIAAETDAASNAVYFELVHGNLASARKIADATAVRMGAQKLAGVELRFRGWLVGLDWHAGEPQRALETANQLLECILEIPDRRLVAFYLCQSLADVGRHEEARNVADEMVRDVLDREGEPFHEELNEAFWATADAAYWSGRARDTLAAIDAYFEASGEMGGSAEGSTIFLSLTDAWARLELELELRAPVLAKVAPLAEGAPVELEAVALLAAGDDRAASEGFARAAALWRGRHFRGELRCRWAEGEALRRVGETEAAIASLTEAERLALERGYEPLLARIRRSLRLAGVHRAAERSQTAAGLTARERETLELVAAGFSNAEIARRLGLGRPTVVRLIRSAQLKLGADTRTHAAAIAAGQ